MIVKTSALKDINLICYFPLVIDTHFIWVNLINKIN